MSEWTVALPGNVLDGHGVLIESASANPVPSCGCEDLVVKGTVEDEVGKAFACNNVLTVNTDGDTVVTDDIECTLLCEGFHLWDLYCMMGSWVPFDIESAADISCFSQTTTTTRDPSAPTQTGSTDGNNQVTLSTYWPPGQK